MRIFTFLILNCCLSGCLNRSISDDSLEDPYEGFNRKSYQLSERMDASILAPLARGYAWVAPDILETRVTSVFKNFNTLPSSLNGFLQGNVKVGISEFSRLAINSSFGLGGLFDVANYWGLASEHEDIGQTLAVWGIKRSPYIFIPLLGPSTIRDIPVRILGMSFSPAGIGKDYSGYLTFFRVVSQRAEMLEATERRDAIAIDPYVFTREAYLQTRAISIFNGDPPHEDFLDEFEED